MTTYDLDDLGFLLGPANPERGYPGPVTIDPPETIEPSRCRWNGSAWEDAARPFDPAPLLAAIYNAYEAAERANLTPAGAIQLAEWCAAGRPKALAVRAWIIALYAERDAKLAAVEGGATDIDPQPSQPWKPHSFRAMAED